MLGILSHLFTFLLALLVFFCFYFAGLAVYSGTFFTLSVLSLSGLRFSSSSSSVAISGSSTWTPLWSASSNGSYPFMFCFFCCFPLFSFLSYSSLLLRIQHFLSLKRINTMKPAKKNHSTMSITIKPALKAFILSFIYSTINWWQLYLGTPLFTFENRYNGSF